MDPHYSHIQFRTALLALIDDTITPEAFAQLESALQQSPEMRDYYYDFMLVHASLKSRSGISTSLSDSLECDDAYGVCDASLWQALADEERQAKTIKIEVPPGPQELITGVRERRLQFRSPRRVSRLSLYTALVGWAALLLVIGYIVSNPPPGPQPTATIMTTVAARWSDPAYLGAAGTRLYNTDTPLHLLEGLVKIQLDDGTEALIQGPASFRAEGTNQLYLEFGKVCSTVPPGAQGFVVRTPSATIIDYGTEFGILVDGTGRTEAHVFKGEVELRCGPDLIRHGPVQRLGSGLAGTVTDQGRLEGPPRRAEGALFISDLSTLNSEAMAGRRLDLADIIGGGNGFGSGTVNAGIDVRTGKKRDWLDGYVQHTDHVFFASPEFPFVDGVFVPGVDKRLTQVASTGLTCDQFDITSGNFWGYIFNGAWHEGAGAPRHTLVLDGVSLDSSHVQAISIHSNMGVTFDLQAMRRAMPGLVPVRFRARAGLSETIARYFDRDPCAEFWVLVDGCVQLRQPARMSDGGFEIVVPLDSTSRFISLAVTETEDGVSSDWAVFVDPHLELALENDDRRQP